MSKSKGLVPVSERALMARVNRAMKKDNQMLRRSKFGSRSWSNTGDYYAIDVHRNAVTATHVDLEEWAREMGVLKGYEELAE